MKIGKFVERILLGWISDGVCDPHRTVSKSYAETTCIFNQPWLNLPKPFFAGWLTSEVARLLELEPARVRFYTAVNSWLDYQWGIDAFVMVRDASGRDHIVTFDLTTHPLKNGTKAHFVLYVPVRNWSDEMLLSVSHLAAQRIVSIIEFRNRQVS